MSDPTLPEGWPTLADVASKPVPLFRPATWAITAYPALVELVEELRSAPRVPFYAYTEVANRIERILTTPQGKEKPSHE